MITPHLIANWKMNGSLESNQALVHRMLPRLKACRVIERAICPPFPYFFQVRDQISNSGIELGAQTVSPFADGAHTGEVSISMIREMGCRFVLVGHSERRSDNGETDHDVAVRFGVVSRAGLVPVLCVGETLDERENGQTLDVVFRQVQAVLDHADIKTFRRAVIAYEPVWAIGTGRTATPAQAQEVHGAIRNFLAKRDPSIAANLPVIYGGSVNKANARELFSQPDINGGLVGGASLKAQEFAEIAEVLQAQYEPETEQ